jgi:hypothetical protein
VEPVFTLNFVEVGENFDDQNERQAQYSSSAKFWAENMELGGWTCG